MANATPATTTPLPLSLYSTIIGGFVGIAILVVTLISWTRDDITHVERRIDKIEDRMGGLEQRMARQEGILSRVFLPADLPPTLSDPDTHDRQVP